jgi:hypothetical protein
MPENKVARNIAVQYLPTFATEEGISLEAIKSVLDLEEIPLPDRKFLTKQLIEYGKGVIIAYSKRIKYNG